LVVHTQTPQPNGLMACVAIPQLLFALRAIKMYPENPEKFLSQKKKFEKLFFFFFFSHFFDLLTIKSPIRSPTVLHNPIWVLKHSLKESAKPLKEKIEKDMERKTDLVLDSPSHQSHGMVRVRC
jgi:hypothetical protein